MVGWLVGWLVAYYSRLPNIPPLFLQKLSGFGKRSSGCMWRLFSCVLFFFSAKVAEGEIRTKLFPKNLLTITAFVNKKHESSINLQESSMFRAKSKLPHKTEKNAMEWAILEHFGGFQRKEEGKRGQRMSDLIVLA